MLESSIFDGSFWLQLRTSSPIISGHPRCGSRLNPKGCPRNHLVEDLRYSSGDDPVIGGFSGFASFHNSSGSSGLHRSSSSTSFHGPNGSRFPRHSSIPTLLQQPMLQVQWSTAWSQLLPVEVPVHLHTSLMVLHRVPLAITDQIGSLIPDVLHGPASHPRHLVQLAEFL